MDAYGGWELRILIADLQLTRAIRVDGETHVGGLMLKLVDAIGVRSDWSDHSLWWQQRKQWLLKTRRTLDQCGVQADSQLEFRRMHNYVRMQLPDLQEVELRVNFAQSVFGIVQSACKELCIRHPEELSLRTRPSGGSTAASTSSNSMLRSLRRSKSKTPDSSPSKRGAVVGDAANPLVPKLASHHSNNDDSQSPQSPSINRCNLLSPASIDSLAFEDAEASRFAVSPWVTASVAFGERGLQRAKTIAEKAAINEDWLDSSKTLMEQDVLPGDELLLRFKYHAYYDLNAKYDSVRINQIFEQARWSLLTEEVDCTEEEMLAMAGLQVQIRLLSDANQQSPGVIEDASIVADAEDEVDAALNDLERSLMGDASAESQVKEIPDLTGHLKVFKPKKYTLKQYKKYYCVIRDLTLRIMLSADDARPAEVFSLKGSEVTSDVNVSTKKFGIRLFVLGESGDMQEVWLRCETREQFSDWTSALRLASRGRTLASKSQFDAEVSETLNHLELQAAKARVSPDRIPSFDPSDFVSPRFLRKYKPKQLMQKIMERHANAKDKDSLQAKLDFVRMWQRLPGSGVAHFVVNYSEIGANATVTFNEFKQKKQQQKEDVIGVSFNKISRLNCQNGDAINTWRYHELESWTVNWEVLNVSVSLSRPPYQMLVTPVAKRASKSALCKTLAEFIGGYVFLSMRKPEKSQELDEQMFHRLTGSRE